MSLPRFRRGCRCLYCRRPLTRWSGEPHVTVPEDAATIDHIFPRWMIRALGGDAAFERWYVRNKAWACPKCNGLKGALHPFEWIWALNAESRNLLGARLRELALLLPADQPSATLHKVP